MKVKCASCREEIIGVQHQSSIYGVSADTWLCDFCAGAEEACIERAGTNDIQQLRDLYSLEGGRMIDFDEFH